MNKTKPTLSPTAQKAVEEFRQRFVLDPARVFFGDPEKLKKQGWEVGESRLIIKQDAEPEDMEQFLIDTIQRVERETRIGIDELIAIYDKPVYKGQTKDIIEKIVELKKEYGKE